MKKTKKLKLLVVDAHSDDSMISSGGFLEKHRHIYEYHFVLVACSDITLHHCGPVSRQERMDEYADFVRHFDGVWHHTSVLPFDADSRMDTVPRSEVVRALENVFAQLKPEVLICHGPSFHQDHTATYEATLAAIRPTARFMPREIYIAENPTYVHSIGPQTEQHSDFFVELNESEMAAKVKLLKRFFPTQVRADGNYLSPEGITSWARYRGIEARCKYAEAFETFMRVI
jgi:LmbE family N-acetylglucosaminyl deacetylase